MNRCQHKYSLFCPCNFAQINYLNFKDPDESFFITDPYPALIITSIR
jgi:hypothetical protein